jgi:hypothetical protein
MQSTESGQPSAGETPLEWPERVSIFLEFLLLASRWLACLLARLLVCLLLACWPACLLGRLLSVALWLGARWLARWLACLLACSRTGLRVRLFSGRVTHRLTCWDIRSKDRHDVVSASIGSHVLPFVMFCLRSGQAAIEAMNQPVNKSAQEPRCWSVRCLSIRLPAGWLAGLLVCSSARLWFCSWRVVVVGSQLTAVQATTGDAVADDTASSGDSSTAEDGED